jgi:hypothetical protein
MQHQVTSPSAKTDKERLEALYARRSAIEDLIASLERYRTAGTEALPPGIEQAPPGVFVGGMIS